MKFLLPLAAALGLLALPASSQVAPSFLPGDDLVGPAAGNQMAPALALGNDSILAVWADSRGSPVLTGALSGLDIWAARLDANGALIDATPFPVNMAGGDQRSPRVAWNGTHWLVAWVGQLPTPGYYTDGLLAARVAADGTLLDSTPIVLRADLGSGTFGDVASDGNGWAVFSTAWSGANSQVVGQRVSAAGVLLDATPKVVATPGQSPNTPYGVTAAWAGTRYLVAWSQWSSGLDNIRGQLADAALAPQGGAFNIASHPDYEVSPDLASDGSQFFAVWDRYNNCCVGGASKAYGTRITTAGAVLDGPYGVAIYDTGGYGFQGCDPAVAWDGTQWVAAWNEPDVGGLRVNAARITAAGVVLDFNGIEVEPLPFRQEAPAVAGRPGGGSLVAWQDSRATVGQPNDIYAVRMDTAGSPTLLGPVANGAPAQVAAHATPGPDGSALLVFTSMASGQVRIVAQRVGRDGLPLGGPVDVASAPVANSARAAWNGSVWMVVWDEYPGGVKARRLDADLVPLDATKLAVMGGYTPDVAAQGDTFLVTALVPETYPEFVDVLARRVSGATGALLDPAPVFVGASYATAQVVEAFEGGFLVAWEKHPTHDNPWSDIGLRFVSALNVPGTTKYVSSTSSYNARPGLAVGHDTALVVWQKNPSTSISEDVLARLVQGSSLALPGGNITVSAASLSQQLPAVGFDGIQYVVAWQDTRANGATWLIDKRTDLYAARVTEGGVVLDPTGLPLATDAVPEAWPTVVGLGIGSALVGWSDMQVQAPFASYRLAYTLQGGASAWVDLGLALAGAVDEPQLIGIGQLDPGAPVIVRLEHAAPAVPATLVIGLSALYDPFKGGVLVPSTDLLIAGLVTDPLGDILLADNWPVGVPPGTVFWFQYWIEDPSGPKGLTASNGLEAFVP